METDCTGYFVKIIILEEFRVKFTNYSGHLLFLDVRFIIANFNVATCLFMEKILLLIKGIIRNPLCHTIL